MQGRIVGKRFYVEGREVTEAQFWQAFPPQPIGDGVGLIGWKPLASEGAAVHPDQVPEAIESANRRGIPTDFDTEGRPIFTSRSHRKRYLKSYGFHDNDGGYGDG